MAGRIRDEDIALVRERAPIADVVGEYLQLRNAGGGSFKGLCPFHDEKTPSFNVTPARGLFYCFGCTEGGDVIAFVQKIEGLGFVEAVETLAQQAGIRLRYEEGGYARGDQSQRQRLLEANKAAQEFYAEQLPSPGAREARRFLTDREFYRADAEHFGVGFAPSGWETLTNHLRKRGFTDQEIITAGLAGQGRRGAYDKFRNRLVWPVREVTGEVVGFGARKLAADDDGPKYLNTPETPVFKKGHLLYGLDLAKRDISREQKAVIVEGYTDVMACHLAGVTTAVATCGTSFGEEHLKVLRRMLFSRSSDQAKVIFTFDGDAAGQKAAIRAFAEEHRFTSETYVAVQRDGLDPCDLRKQRGDAAVADLIDRPELLYKFMVRKAVERYDLDTPEGRIAALDAGAEIIAGIRDDGLRREHAVALDRQIGIMDESFVLRRVGQHVRARQGGARPPRQEAAPAPPGTADSAPYDLRDPSVLRERQALKLALQYPGLAGEFDQFDAETFTVPQHRAVYALIREQGGVAAAGDPNQWAVRLRDAAPNEVQRTFVTQLGVEQIEFHDELGEHFARDLLGTLSIHSINRKEANLNSRLNRLDPQRDAEEYERVFLELTTIGQQKRQIRDRAGGAT